MTALEMCASASAVARRGVYVSSFIASSLQPFHLHIIKAAGPSGGGVGLAEGLDLESGLAGECCRQIAEGDGFCERMAVARTGGRAHDVASMDDRLAAMEGREAFDGKGAQFAENTFGLDPRERVAADKTALVERDAEAETGFIRIVVGAHISRPVEIAFLHPAGVDGAIAGIGDAVSLPRLPQCVIDMAGILLCDVKLVAELADIADAHRMDFGVAEGDLPQAEEREGGVRDIVIGERCEHLARAWPAEIERRPLPGHFPELHPLRQMARNPPSVMDAETRAGDDIKKVGRQREDRDVGLDAGRLVAELGINGAAPFA